MKITIKFLLLVTILFNYSCFLQAQSTLKGFYESTTTGAWIYLKNGKYEMQQFGGGKHARVILGYSNGKYKKIAKNLISFRSEKQPSFWGDPEVALKVQESQTPTVASLWEKVLVDRDFDKKYPDTIYYHLPNLKTATKELDFGLDFQITTYINDTIISRHLFTEQDSIVKIPCQIPPSIY